MDERSLVHSPDARTIEHVFPPVIRTEVTGHTSAGVRIEITKTEEKLVAYIEDPAKLDLIYAQLIRLGPHEARALAANPTLSTSLDTLPAVIVMDRSQHAFLVFGSVIMLVLALTITFLAGSRQLEPSRTDQFFVFPNDGSQARPGDVRAASDAPNGAASRTKAAAMPPPPEAAADPERDQRPTMPPLTDPSPAFRLAPTQVRADEQTATMTPHTAQPSTPADAAPLPSLSRQAALDAAFASGAVQTWSEGGNTGFVIADPLWGDGEASCRTMVLWKRGAEQGDVQKSVKCSNPVSR